ncbi:MAG TPA: methyltransferase domain-containing protein [Candidatus Moranbacteria bacterium]|nr:methyltransferase domain-containing protein [Candidatus Moranbacteria bacterium]
MKRIYLFFNQFVIFRKILILIYKIYGKKPFAWGYDQYKWELIGDILCDKDMLGSFAEKNLPENIGIGIDERVVEYGWIFSSIEENKSEKVLDAGSVFNFLEILNLNLLKNKKLTIFTYYPETVSYNNKQVSYVYGDLRGMPFRDEYYDKIICQSTIEHVDMDNSIYGYKIKNSGNKVVKNYEYLKVIAELYRILKKDGMLFVTFPFGKFENHGFFQQFDSEMLGRIKEFLKDKGELEVDFFKYSKNGWNLCKENDCADVISHNPHTGMGKGDDGAAHCRAVCCIKFSKK